MRKELEECQRDTQVSGVVAVARNPDVLTYLQGERLIWLCSWLSGPCPLLILSWEANEWILVWGAGTLQGPPGTPYEGGVFQLEIIIPPKYGAAMPSFCSHGLLHRAFYDEELMPMAMVLL